MIKYNPKQKEKVGASQPTRPMVNVCCGHGCEIEGVMEVILRVVTASLEAHPP